MTRLLTDAPARAVGPPEPARAAAPPARPAGRRRRAVLGAGSVLLLAAFIADLRLQPGGVHPTRIIDDLVQAAAGTVLSLAAFWRARHAADRLRLSWVLIGLGGAGWAGGQAIWSFYEIVLSVQTPFPSAADVGYLMLPILALAGLLVRPSLAFSGRGRVRVALDVLLVLVSLFTVSWATAFGEVYRGGGDSTLARVVALAYPAGDIALLTVIVIVFSYAHAGNRSGLVLLSGGLAAFALGDSGFAYLTAEGTYTTGNLIDAGWVAGFVIMAWAAVFDRADGRQRRLRPSYLTVLLPCAPTIVGIGFVVWRLGPNGGDTLMLSAGALMVAVLLARQVVVVADNYRLMEQMRYQAFHDPLTGLSNRALFNDRLAHALALHERDHRAIAVILVDLDNFKLVNDSLGHNAGDELLVQASGRLSAAARGGDTVARLGGDEFAILIEDGGDAGEVALRVLAKLSEPATIGERQVASGASIGVAALGAWEPAISATEMLQRADIAMYAAKREGKGLVRSYSADMAELFSGKLDLQAALLSDLAAGRIEVAYQPIYAADGPMIAVEALVRWSYDGKPVPPDVFLESARELGVVNVLDEAVLRTAAGFVARLDGLTLGVNLDRRTLAQPGFVIRLRRILRETGLPLHRLTVEVLEFDLVEQDRAALESLRALRGLGALVSVDDFGAGYATLARLRVLRPDILKIDRSLVTGSEDASEAALLTGAVQLGRHIGASVIAEGVETAAQYAAVLEAGCDAVQGFYLSRPVDAGELRALLAQAREGC